MELRRLTSDIYYFSDNAAECDFIVNAHREKPLCMQVCSHLNHDNEAREIKGLMKALSFFDLAEGYIITAAARDEIITQGKKLHVIPAWEDLAATCGLSS